MDKKLIKNLLEMGNVSGREETIMTFIKEYFSKYEIEFDRDGLGSLFYKFNSKNKNAKTIMIDAHVDEVGFYVTDITKNGLVKIENHGGIAFKNVVSQSVYLINSDQEKFEGIVLSPKPNVKLIEELFIDFGFKNNKDYEKNNIKVGDQIIFNSKTVFTKDRIIGKSIDNRIGTYIVMKLIEYIYENNNFDFNIVIGFSTQEEVGLRGARTSAYKYNPDLGIVIDISPVIDFQNEEEPNGILGEGTMIRHKDAYTIYSRPIVNYLKNLMIKNKIKYQNYISLGGTNAGIIQLTKSGVPVIPAGLVARNIHTNYGVFDKNDLFETIKFLKVLLHDLDEEKIENFKKR